MLTKPTWLLIATFILQVIFLNISGIDYNRLMIEILWILSMQFLKFHSPLPPSNLITGHAALLYDSDVNGHYLEDNVLGSVLGEVSFFQVIELFQVCSLFTRDKKALLSIVPSQDSTSCSYFIPGEFYRLCSPSSAIFPSSK